MHGLDGTLPAAVNKQRRIETPHSHAAANDTDMRYATQFARRGTVPGTGDRAARAPPKGVLPSRWFHWLWFFAQGPAVLVVPPSRQPPSCACKNRMLIGTSVESGGMNELETGLR